MDMVTKPCPFCGKEIDAASRKCGICGRELDAAAIPCPRPLGESRSIAVHLLLTLVTCGFWGLFWLYKMGEEINRHEGQNRINPGLDLVLMFVTCGLWGMYMMYKYPQTLHEIKLSEQMPSSELALVCLLLSFFGLYPVSLMILQDDLNKHWQAHGAPPAPTL